MSANIFRDALRAAMNEGPAMPALRYFALLFEITKECLHWLQGDLRLSALGVPEWRPRSAVLVGQHRGAFRLRKITSRMPAK